MPNTVVDGASAAGRVEGKSVEELLLLVADEEQGFKPEAMERLLEMGLDAPYVVLEQAVRNDDDADLRNSAMEVLVTFGKEAIPKLIRLLRDDNEEVRNFATVMLGDIGSREAVGALIQTLGDPDANVSHGAAEALGKIGDRAALMPLIELLKGDFWLQYAAINAIGEMRDYRAVPHLLQLVDNEVLAVPVVEALGKIGDPRSLQRLGTMLTSVDERLTGLAAKAIVSIFCNLNDTLSYKNSLSTITRPEQLREILREEGVEKLRRLLQTGSERDPVEAAVTLLGWMGECSVLEDYFSLLADEYFIRPVESAILAVGPSAVPRLLDALSHDNENVRSVAVRSLRWLGVSDAPPLITLFLSSASRTIQLEVLESLKEAIPLAILPRVCTLVEGDDEEVAGRAMEVLGRYPYAKVERFLTALMASPDRERRKRAAMLLGSMKDAGSSAVIKSLVYDVDPEVRRETVRSIGLQQARPLLPLVREALNDPDPEVKEEAVRALAEFRDPLCLPELQELLGTSGEVIDYAVVKGIGTIGAPQGGDALMEFLDQGTLSRRVEYATIETLGKIAYKPASAVIAERYLQHADPDIRRLAVETLGSLGDQHSLEGVETAARDRHWSVRIAALHVLGRIGGTREIPLLLAAMDDPDIMVRKHAILALGDLRNITTVPELVKQFTDMEMSRYAFEAVLKFGRTALPWLHRLMKKDYATPVRERVVDLIGKIGDRKSVEPLMELLEDPSAAIRLAAIDSLAFCFDSLLLKRLSTLKNQDPNDDVKSRADLALRTLTVENLF